MRELECRIEAAELALAAARQAHAEAQERAAALKVLSSMQGLGHQPCRSWTPHANLSPAYKQH